MKMNLENRERDNLYRNLTNLYRYIDIYKQISKQA